MKKILLPTVLVAALTGCAGSAQEDEYKQLVAQAENEIKLANKTSFTWRDTEKFLKESQEAKAAGDMDKAVKLAKKALKEAQLAQLQAQSNTKAGPSF